MAFWVVVGISGFSREMRIATSRTEAKIIKNKLEPLYERVQIDEVPNSMVKEALKSYLDVYKW